MKHGEPQAITIVDEGILREQGEESNTIRG
jgi:hypothetical protein